MNCFNPELIRAMSLPFHEQKTVMDNTWLDCTKGLWVLLLGIVLLAGCATAPANYRVVTLSFLDDGKTTKQDALSNLSSACGQYEQGKILTYRLGFDPNNQGYYLNGDPTWNGDTYSLVLIFDEAGVLRRHSLVKVK